MRNRKRSSEDDGSALANHSLFRSNIARVKLDREGVKWMHILGDLSLLLTM